MPFRLGLVLEKSIAVIHRLNPAATASLRPYPGATGGYDKDFREPLIFDSGTEPDQVREDARMELPAVRVPCQIEVPKFEELSQELSGDDPKTMTRLVLWRGDLEEIGLIDKQTRMLQLHVNDRVSCIEAFGRPGAITLPFEEPGLYIVEIQPGSPGFGPDGFDLHICFLSPRKKASG